MAWNETSVMDERLKFIAAVMAGDETMTLLCERAGISRKTGYKWLGRYLGEGVGGLSDRSRAPLDHGLATAPAIVERLNAAINEVMKSKAMEETLAKLTARARPGTPQDFAAFMAAEAKKWSETINAANIRAD